MVKLEVTFDANGTEIAEVKLVDKSNLETWTIQLLPLNETLTWTFASMHEELKTSFQNFDTIQWEFFNNLIPFCFVQFISPTRSNGVILYEQKETISTGYNDVCIYNVQDRLPEMVQPLNGAEAQRRKCKRRLSILEDYLRLLLKQEYRNRLLLKMQRQHNEYLKVMLETQNGLVAQIMQLEMQLKPRHFPRLSPQWQDEKEERSKLQSPIVRRMTSSSSVIAPPIGSLSPRTSPPKIPFHDLGPN